MLETIQIPVYEDNYIYLLFDPQKGHALVVDPAESGPVAKEVQERGLDLKYILNTHHHPDHVGGNLSLKEAYGCTIIGPKADEKRIPGIEKKVQDGDVLDLLDTQVKVFDVPGHTKGHIAFWLPEEKALFCGDTLFSLGCGRLFEGSYETMCESLDKLKKLPGETLVYCAHEYTEANGRFALSVDKGNRDLVAYMEKVREKRARNQPTVPSKLADEKRCNPFLRAGKDSLKEALGLPLETTRVEAFAKLRKAKDQFS